MIYVKQFWIILLFTMLGELLNYLIPLPIPAAIYGLALFFLALSFKIIKPDAVRGISKFLTGILPLLFVAPTVNLIDCLPLLLDNLIVILLIVVLGLFTTFGVSGVITQLLLNRKKGGDNHG